LLENLLNSDRLPVNQSLKGVPGYYFSETYALLAIQYHQPAILKLLFEKGAKPHHPEAGTFLEEYSAYYDPDSNSSRQPESSSSSISEEESEISENDSNTSDDNNIAEFNEEDTEDPLKRFISAPRKYWQTGFEVERGFIDDEGEWISNTNYEPPPHYDTLYLHQAAIHNQVECLDSLLEKYFSRDEAQLLNLKNNYQETPLHVGVLKKSQTAVKRLLEWGAWVDSPDKWRETPLHNAVYSGDLTLAKLLLEYGANPNETNEFDLSPLHVALVQLNLDMVKLLFDYGADFSLKAFNERQEGISATELLKHLRLQTEQYEEIEPFVTKLIELLNYGWDNEDFHWGRNATPRPQLRQKQIKQVKDLITLIEPDAQLSKNIPDFDASFQSSKLKYAIDNGDSDKIDELIDFILNDPDNIHAVLSADAFSFLRTKLLNYWFEVATTEQYVNLKSYAQNYEDNALEAKYNTQKDDQSYADLLTQRGSAAFLAQSTASGDQQQVNPNTTAKNSSLTQPGFGR
jgi:ankyrin repeat protein